MNELIQTLVRLAAALEANTAALTGRGVASPVKATKPASAPVTVSPSADDLLGGDSTPEAVEAPAAPKAAKAPAVNGPYTGELGALVAAIPATITGLARAREIARIKREFAKGDTVAPAAAAPVAAAAKSPAAKAVAAVKASKPAKAAPVAASAITVETLRGLGMKLLKKDPKGGTAALNAAITSCGAKNLTSLAPEQYQNLHDQLVTLIG